MDDSDTISKNNNVNVLFIFQVFLFMAGSIYY